MKKIAAVIILLACVAGVDVAVGRSSLSGDSAVAGGFGRKVTVGILLPLTGERAEEGHSAKRGFDLAANGLRALGAVTVTEDSRCDADYALGAAVRLLEAGAEIIVGELCGNAATAVGQEMKRRGVPFVTLDAGQPTVEGHLDAFVADRGPLADYFVRWHVREYGTEPDYTAALAFDALTAVALEIGDGFVMPEEIIGHLSAMTYHGVAGEVKFRAMKKYQGAE